MTTVLFFALFCAFFLFLSFLESRRNRSLEDFCLAGRSASGWSAGLSIAASSIGASATLGVCGLAFQAGFPAVWWLFSGAIGLAISAVFLVDRIRAEKPVTLLGAIRRKAGGATAKTAGLVILAAWTGILAAQFSAMGRILSALGAGELPGFLGVSGLSGETAALAAGAILIVAVTLLGGQRAVIRSDVCQSLVMAAGLGLLFFSLLSDPALPRASEFFASVPYDLLNDEFGAADWAEFMLLIGGSYLVCPMLAARFLAAGSRRDARIAAVVGIGSLVAAALLMALLGIAARAFIPAGTAPDAVLPALVETRTPFFGALFLFVMTSAVISSADSCLMTSATVAAVDLAGRPSIRATRAAALALSIAAFAAALSGKGVLELLLAANALYVCGVVPVAFAALLSKRPLRAGLASGAIALGSLLGAFATFGAAGAGTKLALYGAGFAAALLLALFASRPARLEESPVCRSVNP